MNFLKKKFKLGSLTVPNNIFYSPLAGCSDYPFRQMVKPFRPGLFFCEMVKMEALIRHDYNSLRLLDYDADMHPIGAQLVGSDPKNAAKAAKIIEELGFDSVDLNCGCPVDKVTKDGSGSGMHRTPSKVGDVIANMVAAVKIPVTVKVRAGWNVDEINAPLITEIAEAAGAVAISVHGRTRAQAYRGEGDRSVIRECKARANNILVIGNGDIFDGPSAEDMFQKTDCDAILVSRGTMGSPWIVEDIIRYLEEKETSPYCVEKSRQSLLDHYNLVLQYVGRRRAALDARRIGCWYFKKSPGTREFRHAISRVESPEEAIALIEQFQHN